MAPTRLAAATAVLAAALPAALGVTTTETTTQTVTVRYARVVAGTVCADYVVPYIGSAEECFGPAAAYVGLTGIPSIVLPGMTFKGCVYNSQANFLMFGPGDPATAQPLASLEYICAGTPTTTTSSSTTTSETSTTSTSITTLTVTTKTRTTLEGVYSLIPALESCAEYQIPNIPDALECFTKAMPFLGLSGLQTLSLPGLGWNGCVFNLQNSFVIFSQTTGASPYVSSPSYRFICEGIATTTTTTVTQTTTSQTTSTRTTSTVTTTTITTSTSTQTTVTTSTSTFTTQTFTTTATTATSSTSTQTTATTTATTATETSTTATYTTSSTTTTTTTTTLYVAFVGDDPISFYDNRMRRFVLPEGELVELLRTPDIALLGSGTYYGAEQYIDRLVIVGTNMEPILQVSIRKNLDLFNRTTVRRGHMETLNVTLDWLGGMALTEMPPPEGYAYKWRNNVVFAIFAIRGVMIGKAQAEMIVLDSDSARLLIMSTAATGFEGREAHLSAKYAHLDFMTSVKAREQCEGVLPELWGFRPFSAATTAMLDDL